MVGYGSDAPGPRSGETLDPPEESKRFRLPP